MSSTFQGILWQRRWNFSSSEFFNGGSHMQVFNIDNIFRVTLILHIPNWFYQTLIIPFDITRLQWNIFEELMNEWMQWLISIYANGCWYFDNLAMILSTFSVNMMKLELVLSCTCTSVQTSRRGTMQELRALNMLAQQIEQVQNL